MSSRGTALRPIRVPEDLYEKILTEIRRTNPNRFDEEFTFSSWMLTAAREKLDLAWRRRTSRQRRRRLKGAAMQHPSAELQPVDDQVVDQVEPIAEQQKEVKSKKRKSKNDFQVPAIAEQLPDVDHSAEQLPYNPPNGGWTSGEHVQTAEELQAERDRDEGRV